MNTQSEDLNPNPQKFKSQKYLQNKYFHKASNINCFQTDDTYVVEILVCK